MGPAETRTDASSKHFPGFGTLQRWIWLPGFLLFLLFNIVFPQSIVQTLPGFSGPLPFKLETGYISVGENDDIQLFYYFIESEKDPDRDPLLLWLTGGPGCSAFSGLVYEIGPLKFDVEAFDGSFPSLLLNPYSWTKVASIIFLDSPVGTGFSYATSSESYYSTDTKATKDTYTFLQKWLLNHPKFIKNRLYIGGDSYGGKLVPLVVSEISEGNKAGYTPHMSIQGYLIGNPAVDDHGHENARIEYAHRMALISDEYYKLAESSCHGDYASPDSKHFECLYALQPINECLNNLCMAHILEPECKYAAPRSEGLKWVEPFSEDISLDMLPLYKEETWCRFHNYVTSNVWANDPSVREALQIREGTKAEWIRCNRSLVHDKDVPSVVQYHQLLSEKEYNILVYSGDHDLLVPYISTLEWIHSLNLTIDDDWRPWTVNSQVAGYTKRYTKNEYTLTFATVKGAGHTAPEYNPKQCLAMVDRWFAYYLL